MTEITEYKGRLATPSTDFVWGDYIDESVVEGLLYFWNNQGILARAPGHVYKPDGIVVDKDYKDSLDLHVPYQIACDEIQNYLKSLQGVLEKYIERFPFCETSRFSIHEPLSIQQYQPGGGFKSWHSERNDAGFPGVYRHLVFMTYLTDNPEGGTEWFHQELYVPAKKGYTVIWPADWTHTHRGRVDLNSEKMIITGWFQYT